MPLPDLDPRRTRFLAIGGRAHPTELVLEHDDGVSWVRLARSHFHPAVAVDDRPGDVLADRDEALRLARTLGNDDAVASLEHRSRWQLVRSLR